MSVQLYNMDCMDYLRSLPDKSFKLAVVDPPYGNPELPPSKSGRGSEDGSRGTRKGITPPAPTTDSDSDLIDTRNLRGRFKRYQNPMTENIPKTPIDWDVAPSEEYFKELFRVSENQIIWGGNYFSLPPTRCFLIWKKLSISENFSMAMAEYAWTSFNDNAKVFEHTPQGDKKDVRFHPTAKPIALYSWILNRYAKEGDNILDTHLGSGSSAIAAYELGFDFVGIEIDEYYFRKAKERIDNRMAQGKLF